MIVLYNSYVNMNGEKFFVIQSWYLFKKTFMKHYFMHQIISELNVTTL